MGHMIKRINEAKYALSSRLRPHRCILASTTIAVGARPVGHVNVRVRLANPVSATERNLESTGLVDTGATFTTIPRQVFDKLGLRVTGKRKVRTATQLETLDESFASIEIDGNLTVTPVLVSDTLEKILIGVITLEALALTVNPTTGKLEEAETYLL